MSNILIPKIYRIPSTQNLHKWYKYRYINTGNSNNSTQFESTNNNPIIKPFNISHFAKPNWSLKESLHENHTDNISNSITPELLKKLCKLSYLSLDVMNNNNKSSNNNAITTNQSQLIQQDLQSIINWISQIKHLDTTGINPMYTPLEVMKRNNSNQHNINNSNDANYNGYELQTRADQVTQDPNAAQIALSNAPYKYGGFFVVPKVVDSTE